MSTKERILTIHLMEKLQKNPEYTKVFGIEAKETSTGINSQRSCRHVKEGGKYV